MEEQTSTQIQGRIMTVEWPEVIDAPLAEIFLKQSRTWVLDPIDLITFDFRKTLDLRNSSYRPLLNLCQLLKKAGKKVVSVNFEERILRQVKLDGVASALNCVPNYGEYLAGHFPQKKNALDVRLINPFLEATQLTLERQTQTQCTPHKPLLVGNEEKAALLDVAIAGVIALNTEQFSGTISLAFPEKVFLKIYESMVGEKVESLTPDIEDAAGELLNIIYGSAKTKLNEELGFKFSPALPTILSGEKIRIRQQTSQKIIVLPFETQHGPFQIEIAFDHNP
ncbi:MAG: chemotaxis protein CheX [Pseudobdellovibrionaceae bacterium]